jgi:hypothetical protein
LVSINLESKIINVFVYSYKNKTLFDNIKDIYKKSSKKNIIKIFIYDQNNLNRNDMFKCLNYVKYTHINWDCTIPFYKYRNFAINKIFDYYFEINDNISLCNEWDVKLLNYLENKKNVILSGSGKINMFIKNNKIQKYYDNNINFNETNFIDLDFIFIKKENIKILKTTQPTFYNQELFLSAISMNNDISIHSVPSYFYKKNTRSFLQKIYIPFSLYENYNLAIEYIKNNNSENFINYHKINIDEIFLINEKNVALNYHYQDYMMDNNETRFLNLYKNIFTKTFFNEKNNMI